jgi:hypothetical protein
LEERVSASCKTTVAFLFLLNIKGWKKRKTRENAFSRHSNRQNCKQGYVGNKWNFLAFERHFKYVLKGDFVCIFRGVSHILTAKYPFDLGDAGLTSEAP